MYVLIGGAGLVGLSLAQKLVELGHTVAVIDIDPTACRYAREQVGAMAFEGSAVSTEVLLEAGIRKADSLAAVLRSDALNLAMVTLAKHYGAPHILTRMRHPDFAEPLSLAGANHIISTVDLAVSTMVNAIEYPQVESMMHFEQGQIEVLKLSIPNNCYVVGRSIAEIAQNSMFPSGSLIIGYQPHPHEDLMIPNGSTVVEPNSTVLMVTKPGSLHQVIDFIQGCK
ncbi:TrkA family potassium uptake protein [Nostocaceae cyanobacterium CENA369]|uniref:TrkA family potassium uptake protein n=1 Tax=Dendronalium phyllosphericum CENA369 TaxID=1725256 RepID=A0A8J7LD59_9NOST|nr:TrkA family potassium uptake protein [Dendronalium phyllosphericum]MBH8571648.1 TrkA family potassium uptake protein [Dendronalium phyllosphericum CENA369]